MNPRSPTEKIEFGDFQTPIDLATRCCRVARDQIGPVDAVVEPTCGNGSFVAAAIDVFRPKSVRAYEIHAPYLRAARRRAVGDPRCRFQRRDFFACNWKAERANLSGSVLFLGNPPWVTSSRLGTIAAGNAPPKSNLDNLPGIAAITGRSNFDIAESVVRQLIEAMNPDCDALAMLVKVATARKVLAATWASGTMFSHASIHAIDAAQSFGVRVDACLMLLKPTRHRRLAIDRCARASRLGSPVDEVAFGVLDGQLVADPAAAAETRHLQHIDRQPDCSDDPTPAGSWRSGVKHDLARVLELHLHNGSLRARDGRRVDIETDRVYPLAKGSDVAHGRTTCQRRRLLIPQRSISESTDAMLLDLPKTYRYLLEHGKAFDARKSTIYRGRDRFAVFGIGPYTFAPWKIAICGLYKRLSFTLFGPVEGRGVVFDDTTYSLSFRSKTEATHVLSLLESDLARGYFTARIFWDAKRPITAGLLCSLDLPLLARELGYGEERFTKAGLD